MANEKRLRVNSIGGLIEDNPLTSSATTLTSAGLAALSVVDSTNHCAIVLDPDGIEGTPEIAYITAHTSSATTATILRAQEGTGALAHSQDIPWVHAPTTKDFDGSGGGAGLIGLTAYNPVSATVVARNSATFADVDATNLVVSFVAPPSGRVLVHLSASANSDVGAASIVQWNLRDSVGDVANTKVYVTGVSQGYIGVTRSIYVSGLTPGTTYTWKWGLAVEVVGGAGARIQYGGATGAAVMEVWAVSL